MWSRLGPKTYHTDCPIVSNCTLLIFLVLSCIYQDFQRVSLSQRPCVRPQPSPVESAGSTVWLTMLALINRLWTIQLRCLWTWMRLGQKCWFNWKFLLESLDILGHLRTCRILLNGLHQDLQEVELHLGGVSHVHGWQQTRMGSRRVTEVKDETFNGDYWHGVWSSSKLVVDSLWF